MDLFTRIVMWLATGVNLLGIWISWRTREEFQKRLAAISEPRMRHDISLQIHDGLLERIGTSCDLIDRAITDLTFLHGQVYSASTPEHCPICSSTVPELEELRGRLQSIRVDVIEGGGPRP